MQGQGVLGGLLIGAALAQSALAQAPLPAQSLPLVEVTGSNIKQAEAEGAAPVQVITREEIQRTGANSLKELFDAYFSIGAGQSDTGGRGTFSAGSSAAALRGISSRSTLVLLNSRRVAPYPLAEYSDIFVNIDSLPLEAVERVEILRSGASAIYGSEAVAGVINIITRQSYQGLSARASHQHSGGDQAICQRIHRTHFEQQRGQQPGNTSGDAHSGNRADRNPEQSVANEHPLQFSRLSAKPIRIWKRQRLEQHAIEDTEDGGIRANAEGECEYRGGGKAG